LAALPVAHVCGANIKRVSSWGVSAHAGTCTQLLVAHAFRACPDRVGLHVQVYSANNLHVLMIRAQLARILVDRRKIMQAWGCTFSVRPKWHVLGEEHEAYDTRYHASNRIP
jgi:hypothetical protein